MDKKHFLDLMAASLPPDGAVTLGPKYTDERGDIINLVQRPLGSASLITSKVGTLRAGHYHKEDWHYCYVLSGSIAYFSRPVGSESLNYTHVATGQMFFTPPMWEHWMVFLADTSFLTFGGGDRTQEHYEEDLIRVATPKLVEDAIQEIKDGHYAV